MNKLKILVKVGRKFLRKSLRGDFKYKGRFYPVYAYYGTIYLFKYGPAVSFNRFKQHVVGISRRHLEGNLAFPNGLVTGVSPEAVLNWYEDNGRPVTIVIPSYNDLTVLVPCLESIAMTTDPELVKVLIVDDYCQPENSKKLKELENEQVTVILREKNGGFAKAVNTGLKAANPKYDVILLNSDTEAHPGWIQNLQFGAYEFGVDTGIVGPKLLYPDGRIQSAGSHRNTDVPEFFDHYYRFQESNYGPANIPQYCLGVTGACMYIKREFLNYVGILDEDFEFAFEDMDLCLRGWETGYRSLYFPGAVLTHHESVSRPKNKGISEKEKQSVEYFWQKWGDWFDNRNVKNKKGQPRIIFVLQTFGLSGGIKNIFELANRLSKYDYAIEIWGIDRNPSPWEVSDKILIRTFNNYYRLIAALEPEQAIKVATWWETSFPVWLASVRNGVPVYFISEFETWFYPDDIVAQSSVVSCYRKEFRNLTISSYNLDELRAIGLNATLLPCGYEDKIYKQLPGIKRQEDAMLGVGRTFFQKNLNMTLAGWKLLGDKRPNLWLYGFEPHLAKIDTKIKYYTKPTNEEVNELYNKATFFVQTSRHEGFCLPILEAMAAGCPVICTDAHGNRDFSFDGKNCLMVEQDNPESLKTAIEKMMKDKKLRDKLAKEALKTAKKFRWEAIVEKADKFFGEVH
jgi:GT2 family glycosyltransferase